MVTSKNMWENKGTYWEFSGRDFTLVYSYGNFRFSSLPLNVKKSTSYYDRWNSTFDKVKYICKFHFDVDVDEPPFAYAKL